MTTHAMKRMNKSQKKKLKRLQARQQNYDALVSKLGNNWGTANKRPGSIK